MRSLRRKTSWLALGALLICGGIGLGAIASSLTTSSIVWRPPPRLALAAEPLGPTPVDQAGAGQAWARTAFDSGLRQCPKMNSEFLAACEAEMAALASRPALPSGSYGGPLLITKVEASVPEPEYDSYEPEPPELTQADEYPWDGDRMAEVSARVAEFIPSGRTPDNYPAAAPPE